MNGKIVIVECKSEYNQEFNDDFDLCERLSEIFEDDPRITTVEIFLLDDDYADFLRANDIEDSQSTREKYVLSHPYKNYEQAFINSSFSEVIDTALMPVAIYNKNLVDENFEIKITDDRRKKLSEYFGILFNENSAANPVFGGTKIKKVCTSDYILKYDSRIFDNEDALIGEILDAENFGITRKYKNLSFISGTMFTVGFVYVISINKISRVMTREKLKSLTTDFESFVTRPIDTEQVQQILSFDDKELFIMCNYLIYPYEVDEQIELWANQIEKEARKQMDDYDKLVNVADKFRKKDKK